MEGTSGPANSGREAVPESSVQVRTFGNVPGWNGLRGLAVLIVFVAHMEVILPIPTLLVIPGRPCLSIPSLS